mmetsp:Transcript_4300/g.7009  ORF Transcript_4300/g.7009 Transcript_4300/m.7009 type:complete len:92 (+) Transcript_4300:229-504(+)
MHRDPKMGQGISTSLVESNAQFGHRVPSTKNKRQKANDAYHNVFYFLACRGILRKLPEAGDGDKYAHADASNGSHDSYHLQKIWTEKALED